MPKTVIKRKCGARNGCASSATQSALTAKWNNGAAAGSATSKREEEAAPTTTSRRAAGGGGPLCSFLPLLLLLLLCGLSRQPSGAEANSPRSTLGGYLAGQGQGQASEPANYQTFDSANYRSVYEAIRAHPELREFASLCESEGVKEIVSMDRTPLTVFAPIDSSLSELLPKARLRSINLAELAKHHIAQGFVSADESTRYPLQFASYSLLSPLYLNQAAAASSARGQPASLFVNNAKVLATHLVQIEQDQFQVLHLIDQPLEFAYVNRRTQVRGQARPRAATVRRAASLDDVLFGEQPNGTPFEFYERFGELSAAASEPQLDLYRARAFRGSQQLERLSLSRDQFNFEQLARAIRRQPQLRGRLFQVNETSSLNTYFLPLNSDELVGALESGALGAAGLEAHVIPDQVLFTRLMPLGSRQPSLLERNTGQRAALSLAKTLPHEQQQQAGRQLLATPLLVQSKCQPQAQNQAPVNCQAGITSAEILVANIPLSNGVLHLIGRPLLTPETNLLDYLNDHDNQLSVVVNALGSQTAGGGNPTAEEPKLVGVSRFRELLAAERQTLAALAADSLANITILVPSDEAFERLRYDLRALVQGDETLIPRHWDSSYRHDLLERLLKRHVVLHQTITSDQMFEQGGLRVLSENGKLLTFSASGQDEDHHQFTVSSDSTSAKLIHRDLIGRRGVLHIIDSVLGEEQETVHSLLGANLLRSERLMEAERREARRPELGQLVEANLGRLLAVSEGAPAEAEAERISAQGRRRSNASQSGELAAISNSIGQYLEELGGRQLELLAASVNISYQLAKLTSLAEGLEDWNEKFKQPERAFTYFVPSDLAWLRLQQSQPELYKPLAYFLNNNNSHQQQEQRAAGDLGPLKSPRSSQSSQRLRQILERHLLVNRKLDRQELRRAESLQTLGATLRLVESGRAPLLTATPSKAHDSIQAMGDFAALNLAAGQPSGRQQPPAKDAWPKSLRLAQSNANIVQVNEASNGFVYIIDNVLLLPEDADYIVQTSVAPAVSSSLLGAHNSAILDFINGLLSPGPLNLSAQSIIAVIGTLSVAITVLLVLALVLTVRKRRQNKLNRHHQLESGLTSSSSANSGSTSTTKSL